MTDKQAIISERAKLGLVHSVGYMRLHLYRGEWAESARGAPHLRPPAIAGAVVPPAHLRILASGSTARAKYLNFGRAASGPVREAISHKASVFSELRPESGRVSSSVKRSTRSAGCAPNLSMVSR